jgi:hypothetical protein
MASPLLDQWVYRGDPLTGSATTISHYVESEIEDRAVTSCGRQMHRKSRGGHLFPATDPWAPINRCSSCKAHHA